MDYIIQDGELYHHGIKGMRWGVRRFQNADGSLTNAGKKRINRKQKKALEKARKAKQAKAEAAKKAKQEQEDFEVGKKKAIESGSASDVLKYKGKLTTQELQTAFNRINLERQLSDISAKENSRGKSKIESITDKLDKANNLATKGINAWNTAAKILNSTTNADLPTIDGTKKKDKAVDKLKKKLVKSGTVKEIEKNLGKFDSEEIKAINTRLAFEEKIRKKSKESESESSSGDKTSTRAEKYNLKRGAKRDINDLSNTKWVKKETDRIINDITSDHITNYGHRQDIVDKVNQYIEELDD